MRYWVYGTNSMGSTWYLSNKDSKECTLWTGAPKEMRAAYDNLEQARAKVKELDEAFKFASTRHSVQSFE